jgi:hypothetical protein
MIDRQSRAGELPIDPQTKEVVHYRWRGLGNSVERSGRISSKHWCLSAQARVFIVSHNSTLELEQCRTLAWQHLRGFPQIHSCHYNNKAYYIESSVKALVVITVVEWL